MDIFTLNAARAYADGLLKGDSNLAALAATAVQEYMNSSTELITKENIGTKISEELSKSKVVDITKYGAIANGITDCRTAMLAAIEDVKEGGTIYFPNGTYLFEKGSEYIELPDVITLKGDNNTVIVFNDTEAWGKSLFTGGYTKMCFDNITFKATLLEYQSTTNRAQLYYNGGEIYNEYVEIKNCSFWYFRYTVMSSWACKKVRIYNNDYHYVVGDCNRFLNCVDSIVTNNSWERCADDCVSFHYHDYDCPFDYSHAKHIISNNIFELSFGIGLLGADNVLVSNNVFKNTIGAIMKFGYSTVVAGKEEGKDSHNISIINNIVESPITNPDKGTGRTFITLYSNCENVNVGNNSFVKGDVTEVENFVWQDVTVTDNATVDNAGFEIVKALSTLKKFKFKNNYCNTGAIKDKGVRYLNLSAGECEALIEGNTFEDFTIAPIYIYPYGEKVVIRNNTFNGDMNNRLGLNGIYTSYNQLQCVYGTPCEFSQNKLYNVSSNVGSTGGNELYVDFSSGRNVGIYGVMLSNGDIVVPYDYENDAIRNIPLSQSNEMPSSGYYYKYHFVRYVGDEQKLLGWKRLTTGNGHVSGTDWLPIYISLEA